jgi:signal peptidase II
MFEFYWPSWVPVYGGEPFLFFSPVFNIADSSIFIGVVSILLFQKTFFNETGIEILNTESEAAPSDNPPTQQENGMTEPGATDTQSPSEETEESTGK